MQGFGRYFARVVKSNELRFYPPGTWKISVSRTSFAFCVKGECEWRTQCEKAFLFGIPGYGALELLEL